MLHLLLRQQNLIKNEMIFLVKVDRYLPKNLIVLAKYKYNIFWTRFTRRGQWLPSLQKRLLQTLRMRQIQITFKTVWSNLLSFSDPEFVCHERAAGKNKSFVRKREVKSYKKKRLYKQTFTQRTWFIQLFGFYFLKRVNRFYTWDGLTLFAALPISTYKVWLHGALKKHKSKIMWIWMQLWLLYQIIWRWALL